MIVYLPVALPLTHSNQYKFFLPLICMKRVLQVVFETNAFGLLWDISNTALVKWTQDCRVVIWAESGKRVADETLRIGESSVEQIRKEILS
jgi:hypothetical protein